MSALVDILSCKEVAWFAAASLLILGGSTWQILRLNRQNKQLTAAVGNISQGLCMWDGDLRLVVCNPRYVEMFGMEPSFVKPGRFLREILEHRAAVGSFKGNVDQYIAEVMSRIAQGRASTILLHQTDGRVLSISERPLAGGGWVATLEDVTDHYLAEQQRAVAKAG